MFTEDLSVFFADFSVPATLAGVEVRGIFDEPHARGDVGMLGMSDARPTFTLPTADIPLSDADPGAADLRLVVRGATYRVTEHQPDGTGMSVLVLSREVAL